MTNLAKQLDLALAGHITFDGFTRATQREFAALAANLLRRWAAPAWVSPDDLVQDLLIGTWQTLFPTKAARAFDPSRGVTLLRFVVYNAMSYAKRALHKARGAKLSGSADKNPSRIERPISSFGRDEDEDGIFIDRILAEEPIAERTIIDFENRQEAVQKALRVCTCARERVAVLAISEAGDIDEGGRLLYDDLDSRIALHLGSEEQATRYVTRAARAVVRRLDATSAS